MPQLACGRMKRAFAVLGLLGLLVACAPIDADSSKPASSKPASNAAEAVQPHGPVIMYGDSLLEEAMRIAEARGIEHLVAMLLHLQNEFPLETAAIE